MHPVLHLLIAGSRSPRDVLAGFSLITISITIMVASLIFVSFLPGKDAGDYNTKIINDVDKLNRIEEAMRSFMAYNGRRPCPSDGSSKLNTATFGREAGSGGACATAPLGPNATPTVSNCNGGTTGCMVAGGIPVTSLGLGDEYAFDEYGRRFTYVVDMRATGKGSCASLQNFPYNNGMGNLQIEATNGGTLLDQTMYAYISHGPDGYGAFPEQGSTAAGRIFSGSNDTDTMVNAGATSACTNGKTDFSSCTTSDFTNLRIQKPYVPATGGATGFDDLVWYRPDIKNICCLGISCVALGFRIDGNATAGQEIAIRGIGDINGDGIPDLVITTSYNYAGSKLYVIFGTSNSGGTSTSTVWPALATGFDPTKVNGTNGFIINLGSGYIGENTSVIVADVNQDGFADVVVGGVAGCCNGAYGSAFIIFGGYGGGNNGAYLPAAATTLNVSALNGYTNVSNSNAGNGTSGVTIYEYNAGGVFPAAHNYYSVAAEVTPIDETGYPAIIILGSSAPSSSEDLGYVIFGKPTTGNGPNGATDNWANTKTIDASTLDGTVGFQFYSSNTNLLPHDLTRTPANGIAGDFDHDGYGDILLNNFHTVANGTNGIVGADHGADFIISGRTRADWQAAYTTYNGNTHVIDLEAELSNGDTHGHANRATEFWITAAGGGDYFGPHLFVADLNGDGYPDFMTSGLYTPLITIYGGSRWPETKNVWNIGSGQGFYFNPSVGGSPAWLVPSYFMDPTGASAFDLNGDGKLDLVLGYTSGAPLSRTNAGAVFVVYQPAGGWANSMKYSDFKWDGSDSFQIYGPQTNGACGASVGAYIDGIPWVADVRPGDSTPEILVTCNHGEGATYGSIYGIYENKAYFGPWQASYDLANWN